jgi:hypothetical protein
VLGVDFDALILNDGVPDAFDGFKRLVVIFSPSAEYLFFFG